MKHKKPTKEELETDLKKTQEELEVTPKETPKEEPEVEVPVEEKEEVVEDKPNEPAPNPSEPEVIPSEPAPSPDYKEKFSESSREAQKIHAKNRTINDGMAKASEVKDVTDDELLAEYPDWDVMSETERKLARKNLINDKRFKLVEEATQKAKKIEKWADDVGKFVGDPKTLINYPELEGKQEDFEEFANRTENHAVPFNVLVGSFIYNMNKTVKPKSKGKMFETGSGGPNTKIKTDNKISVEEAAFLMKTDYKKYKEFLIAGKIKQVEE